MQRASNSFLRFRLGYRAVHAFCTTSTPQDVVGLSRFRFTRIFWPPVLIYELPHPSRPRVRVVVRLPMCSSPLHPSFVHHSSVNLSNRCMLRIMTNSPTVTMINSANPNQPSTIALVPTPLFTEPFPRSCATCAAATDAVCCQRTLTRTKIDAMKMSARATCETGRDGKGLMSMSDPVRASCSSCQPGKVARRRKVMNARTIAMMLRKI